MGRSVEKSEGSSKELELAVPVAVALDGCVITDLGPSGDIECSKSSNASSAKVEM